MTQKIIKQTWFSNPFVRIISLVPWMMFVGVPLVDALLRRFSAKSFKKG